MSAPLRSIHAKPGAAPAGERWPPCCGPSACRCKDLAVEVEQLGDVGGVDPAHPALGADSPITSASGRGGERSVHALDLPGGRAGSLIGWVVGNEREVQLG